MLTELAQYFNLADKIVLLDRGSIKAQGPWSQMASSVAEVKKFELDQGHDAPSEDAQHVKKKSQVDIDAEHDVDRRTGDLSLYCKFGDS